MSRPLWKEATPQNKKKPAPWKAYKGKPPKRKKHKKSKPISFFGNKTSFYRSKEWLILRVRVLEAYSCSCMMCGRSPKDHKVVLHVDHIKPRSKYPRLELEFNNLQILCADCNLGKSNKFETDHRPNTDEINELLDAIHLENISQHG